MPYRADQVDRRYNDWHYTLPIWCKYMDLDGVEFGPGGKPLALIETTGNPGKATTIMCSLARSAGIPAYLVLIPAGELTDETEIRVRRVEPLTDWRKMTLAAWGEFIKLMHVSAGLAGSSPAARPPQPPKPPATPPASTAPPT
jgi:hypothetical protein